MHILSSLSRTKGKRKESQDDLADKQLKHILFTFFLYHAIIYKWKRPFLYCVGLDGTIHMRFLSLVSKIVTVFVYLDPNIPNSDDMV